MSSPLLREWNLLQEQVVPPLLEVARLDRDPQTWSVGSVADAVAVVTAYRHARFDGSGELTAFASGAIRALSPVTFTLSEVRCIPARTRRAAFERHEQTWVPGEEITEQVVLAEPEQPVDLVTLRPDAAEGIAEQAIDQLREGGHLVLLEPWPGLEAHRGLRPLDSQRRIFRKCGRPRPVAAAGSGRPSRARLHKAPGVGRRTARVAAPDAPPAATLTRHQAQSDLVAGHARLARSLARRFSHHGEAKEDLEQVALMALVKAARRYDASRETSFSTYATASILGEIKRHFRDKTWMMRVPRSVQESYLAVKEARESLTHELARSPTIAQVAARLHTSEEAVLEAMEAGENYWPESLDVGAFDGETGRDVPVEDGGYDLTLEREQLTSLLPRLAPRERLILRRIYFDGWTQRQVANEVGVSQMQVSRLLSRTVDKLRACIAE